MAKYHGTITEEAVKMMAQITAGQQLIFTKMEYGDGQIPGLNEAATDTDLVTLLAAAQGVQAKKAELYIEKCVASGETVTLTGTVRDDSVSGDFRITELGVYAKAGADGEEKLFAYYTSITYIDGKEKDESDYLTLDNLDAGKRKHILGIEIGKTEIVSLELDMGNTGDYIERGEFNSMVDVVTAAMKKRAAFDFVVDSDAAFAQWAACVDGSLKRVLILPGTYTLDDKMINSNKTGTEYVYGLPGAKLVFNYQKGFGVGENSDRKIIIENVDVEVDNYNDNDTYGIYYGGEVRNSTIIARSENSPAYALMGCSGENVKASGIGGIGFEGYGFKDMSFCTRCRSAEEKSTTATWTGTNAYIDSNTCDIA